ncbi:hypothetical protein [Streptomyces sp. NPDC048188]|uniref:hypothetical protein n=1 Tax=Streptomyces sp. NPDC048188 TaxID=3155749 RepID=UPI0034173223
MLPHALVVPADAEDDGDVGEDNEDQEHGVEPARPPLSEARAREMTAGLRDAMDDVRPSVAVLAARVRAAHTARVWVPLGHSSWESYCAAEFGISRAQAYRLLDVARALTAIHDAVAAGPETSLTRGTDPGAAAALDYGLSQRALIAVSAVRTPSRRSSPPTRCARPQRPPGPRHRHGARRGPPGRPRRPHRAAPGAR